LRALVVVGCAAVLLWIWSDVAPALTLLGDIKVWASSDVVGGKTVALSVSLRDVLEAVLVLALTWIATRNLPGLIELSLLRRLHVDAPTRYAITSVTRYAIVFTGTIVGLAMLGLHWSNLQWLAAGFSVGLGFGLQEIFANFVSGLMVLVERPFRIGDIVSIGEVEGTVARIRTRATTIVDWDNKEVIVPNKSFITERLTNWSLSNTVTRVVLRIGAAYASDPRQVRELLLEIARAEPLVVDDPAPSCWFVQISACTFDFDLRVFIADIGDRNRARDALYMRIAEVFREKNIEMAFPQTDIWFRNAMPLTPVQPAPSADAASASKRT
jgi:potassium efflux system protein